MMQTSTDLFFSAFLHLSGIKISSYEKLERGRIKFHFAISDAEWKEFKIKFNNSEFAKMKQTIEQLKDLCY